MQPGGKKCNVSVNIKYQKYVYEPGILWVLHLPSLVIILIICMSSIQINLKPIPQKPTTYIYFDETDCGLAYPGK